MFNPISILCLVVLTLLSLSTVEAQACTAPSSSSAGYNGAGKTETSLDISTFQVTGWTCATGYTGTAAAGVCSNSGNQYGLTGCSLSTCTTPSSSSTGYNGASRSTTSLAINTFQVTGWTCATGYTGNAAAVACTTHNTKYSLSGCSKSICQSLTSSTGYSGTNKVETNRNILGFQVTGWTCATGYTGSAAAAACATHNQVYSLSGCSVDSCTSLTKTGYLKTNVQETSLVMPTWTTSSVTGWTCHTNAGWTGSANDRMCTSKNRPYILSGCTLTDCVAPVCPSGQTLQSTGKCTGGGKSDCAIYGNSATIRCTSTLGYYWTKQSNDLYSRSNFLLRSLQCDAGWYGYNSARTQICNSVGNAWTYNGCTKCSVGTFTSSRNKQSCTLCPKGWYQSQMGQKICTKCPKGQYSSATGLSVCKNCVAGKAQGIIGSTSCSNCVIGKYSKSTKSVSCKNCPAGYKQQLTAKTSCTSCTTGLYQNLVAQSTCISCPRGKYTNQNSRNACKSCGKGYYQDQNGKTSCKVCANGRNAINEGTITGCATCSQGKASTSRTAACATCTSGRYQEKNVATYYYCKQCQYGVRVTSTGCVACSIGKYQDQWRSSCKSCGRGYFADVTGLKYCKNCPVGYYQPNYQQSSCVACAGGKYHNQNARYYGCKSCPSGYYQDQNGKNGCKLCANGQNAYYSTRTGCTTCSQGKASTSRTSSCATCSTGRYQESNVATYYHCKYCSVGTSQNSQGQSSCNDCIAGQYTNQNGRDTCKHCSRTTYQNQKKQTRCKNCNAGQYQDQNGKASCKACTSGQHQDQSTQQNCKQCTAGKYQDQNSRSTCKNCGDGKYQRNTGQNICVSCPAGQITVSRISSCANCAAGKVQPSSQASTYAVLGIGMCSQCAKGKAFVSTSSACTPCETGMYQPKETEDSPSCEPCVVGKYQSEKGFSLCYECPTGYLQPVPNSADCKACSYGQYSDEKNAEYCKECQVGKYQSEEGETLCSECTGGQYQANKKSFACSMCDKGRYGTATGGVNNTVCFDCIVGKYQDYKGQGNCKLCKLGMYNDKVKQLSEDACNPCVIGKYADQESTPTCTACPDGRYSDELGTIFQMYPITETPLTYGTSLADKATEKEKDCKGCPSGTRFQMTGSNPAVKVESCIKCDAGQYSTVGSTICTLCAPGKYRQADADANACQNCPLGKYGQEKGASLLAQCLDCTTGQYNYVESVTSCKKCSKGKYSNTVRRMDHKECDDCNPGRYADGEGTDLCTWCTPGKYNTEFARDRLANCKSCGVGLYESGSTQDATKRRKCDQCPNGRYNAEETGSSLASCIHCASGNYQTEMSKTLCVGCPIGYYGVEVGAVSISTCLVCPVGTYQTKKSTTNIFGGHGSQNDGCISCMKGTYRVSWRGLALDTTYDLKKASSDCTSCIVGKYQDQLRQTDCKFCGTDKGHYNKDKHGEPYPNNGIDDNRIGEPSSDNCLDCPSGKQSNVEHNGCSDCNDGTYKTTGQTRCQNCESCEPGKSRWSQLDKSPVMSCFGSTGGTCKLCTQNQWKKEQGVWNSQCVTCPDGWTAANDRTHCIQCEGEEAGTNGWCGRDNVEGGGLTCTDIDGDFPNEQRTACRQIENVQVVPARSNARISSSAQNEGYRRHDEIFITWDSNNIEQEFYVIRICQYYNDRSICHSDSTSVVQNEIRIRNQRNATVPLTFCSSNNQKGDLQLFVQVGQNIGSVNHNGGQLGVINDMGKRVRGSSTPITLLKNIQPYLNSEHVQIQPTKIYSTSPAIACVASPRAIVDPDALFGSVHRGHEAYDATTGKWSGNIMYDSSETSDRIWKKDNDGFWVKEDQKSSALFTWDVDKYGERPNSTFVSMPNDIHVDFSTFGFYKGKTETPFSTTSGKTRNTYYSKTRFEKDDEFQCHAQPTDECGAGTQHSNPSSTKSNNKIQVTQMLVTPNTGHIRGGETVKIEGRGFISERRGLVAAKDNIITSMYTCKFEQTNDGKTISETFPGRGISSSLIECSTGNFKGNSGETQLKITGPILQYKGCWESNDLPSSFEVINDNERQTSLMRCQLLCAFKHQTEKKDTDAENPNTNMMYGLRNNQCLCSKTTFSEDSTPKKKITIVVNQRVKKDQQTKSIKLLVVL